MEIHIDITRVMIGWIITVGVPLLIMFGFTAKYSEKGKCWENIAAAGIIIVGLLFVCVAVTFVTGLFISGLHFINPSVFTDCPLCTVLGIAH